MPSLPRAITLTLIAKLIGLALLWALFFRSDTRPHPDSGAVADALLTSETTTSGEARHGS